jgi:hypothetical protein
MAYNFVRGDRDQPFLLPPDLRDWLPDGHLAWFVLDVVDQLDLTAFLPSEPNDGHGHPADVQQLAPMLMATTPPWPRPASPSARPSWRPTLATGRSPTLPRSPTRPSC